jgi:hypothetical protein
MNQVKCTSKEPHRIVPNFLTKKIKIYQVKPTTVILK